MIKSYRDPETRKIGEGKVSRRLPAAIQRTAFRKLRVLDAADSLQALTLPGNNLEAIKGDRKGQYSIRVNKKYRVCFRWTPQGPTDVEIVDYH